MITFRALVHGQGMVLRRWLLFRRTVGFYATRYVEAESHAEAQERALEQVQGDPTLALGALRAAELTIEEVEQLDGVPDLPQPGLVFYKATQYDTDA